MRTLPTLALGLVALLPAPAARAQETPVKGRIVAADLFKNGLAVVRYQVTLGKPGVYVLDDVPGPVHGTYWVEGGPVETVVQMREVDVPAAETPPGNLQDDLAGRKVTVHFKGGQRPPVVGTVMRIKPPRGEEATQPARFLVIQTAKGRTYVDLSEVASVEAEDAGDTVKRTRPRLLLVLGPTDKPQTTVTLRYLARGLSWAPSYRIDISDPRTLALEQHAVVRNELADFDAADLRLISGYPSVQYAHVRSPLDPRTGWSTFFQELAVGPGTFAAPTMNAVRQQAVGNNRDGLFDLGLGAIPAGEGVDLHYQPIGKRTLAQGEAMALTVAGARADYERVVEWLVPDTRNEYGQYDGRPRGDDEDDAPWDALRFKNPLPFPLTTAPATVTAGGQFNGQRTVYWVNPGEETLVRVGKALSVRTRSVEHEEADKGGAGRDVVWVGGRQYRRSTVAGELAVNNHRKETVQVVIRRRFSGDLVKADGDPRTSLREEGVFSVNRRNELVWTLPLKAGEERTLKYTYTVLVPN